MLILDQFDLVTFAEVSFIKYIVLSRTRLRFVLFSGPPTPTILATLRLGITYTVDTTVKNGLSTRQS